MWAQVRRISHWEQGKFSGAVWSCIRAKDALPWAWFFAFYSHLLVFLKVFCRLLSLLPLSLVAAFCRFLGFLVRVTMPGRGRTTLRALSYAFPEKTEAWRRAVFRDSAARLFELGLYRPTSAFFSDERCQSCLEISEATLKLCSAYEAGQPKHGHPVVILLPHMTMAEAATLLPSRLNGVADVSVIFRPLNQASLNDWVTQERERFGAKLLSRKSGYNDAMAALRKGEIVAVLFDQDASKKGSTITFMDRIVSATDLPGLMAHRFKADVFLMLLERRGFWKAELTLEPIERGDSPTEMTIHAHDALERYLRRDANTAADWLWLHDRWDHFCSRKKRFRLPTKRNFLELSNQIHGYAETPRKTRIWIRLPNWLGDVVMALPVLRAIREGRPDFEFTLIGKSAFRPLVDRLGVADRFIPLPQSGRGYFRYFWSLRTEYPSTYLLFTNSVRGDLEAFLTRCPQRMSMLRPGKRRPLLTDFFPLPESLDERTIHQTMVWEKMARYCGLVEPLRFEPVEVHGVERQAKRIGLICGTENSPEKRWPIERWRELTRALLAADLEIEVVLYGTPADKAITDQVCEGLDASRIQNLAGATNLAEFCDGLVSCSVICCNDTGGMHLANMMGTPVVAVFGPTNPVRTGPIFSTKHTILQPENCPETGGLPITGVTVERCLDSILLSMKGASA